MIEKIERLLALLTNLPQTVDRLQEQGAHVVMYAQWIFYIALLVGGLYVFRTPIMFLIERSRWHAMRKIDKEETETAQVRTAVEIAKAKKGQDVPVTTEDIVAAAREDYGKIVLALREGHKQHKL